MRRFLSIPLLLLIGLVALPAAAFAAQSAAVNKTTLPVIQFKFTGTSVNENGGQASISFTRTGNNTQLNQVSTVLFTTNGGSATGGSGCGNVPTPDYVTATNRVITFPAGSTLQTTTVQICNQLTYDGNETVNMVITSPTGAQLNFQKNTSVATIVETNPKASISVTGASGPEGSILSFPVTLTGATALPVTVSYTESGGTAVAGTDYTLKTGTLTWGPQTLPTTQSVTVQTLDNGVENGNLTFNLVLSSPINGSFTNSSAVGTITNVDSAPSASADSPSAWEGSPLGFTVTLSHASAFPITVGYNAANFGAVGGALCGLGADYLTTSGTLNFAAGILTQPVSVPTCASGSTESDRLVLLQLGPTTDGSLGTVTTSNSLATIKDLDPASLGLSVSQAGTSGNTGQTGSAVATVKNADGDELTGHLVRFELYQSGLSTVFIFPVPFDATQLDLGTLVAGTPTCPSLGCAAFANTGSGFAAGGFAATETPGQAKMTWTDIDTSPSVGGLLYDGTTTDDTVVACLADDGTGVAAIPTCGIAIIFGSLDESGLSLPGAATDVFFGYNAPN